MFRNVANVACARGMKSKTGFFSLSLFSPHARKQQLTTIDHENTWADSARQQRDSEQTCLMRGSLHVASSAYANGARAMADRPDVTPRIVAPRRDVPAAPWRCAVVPCRDAVVPSRCTP
jgi:hypothetical protein